MNVDVNLVQQLVQQILAQAGSTPTTAGDDGVFATMDEAVNAALVAYQQYRDCSLSDRAKYIQAIRDWVLQPENLEYMAKCTVEESGMGNFEHKVLKNTLAATKTPGVEDLTTEAITGDDGISLTEYSPFGVIGSICPTTNPTETIIGNGICMLAAGNTIVFSPHPRSKHISLYTVQALNRVLKAAGAPANLMVTVAEPSIENTEAMMAHPKIRMLCATGGPAIVNTVLRSGKKAIGAGAGNPPAVVDETADIEKAAADIVAGASFDNNLPCIAEKEIIAVESIADYLMFNLKKNGAYELTTTAEIEKLMSIVCREDGGPKTSHVGKSAKDLLAEMGINVGDDIKIITMQVGEEHPLVQHEMLMPIVPMVRVPNVDEAIEMAVRVEHDCRHTAIMHSRNVDKLSKMAKLIQTTIFVKNGPSYAGIGVGGMGCTTFTIAGPTGEGITTPKSFARRRRCVLVDGFDIR